MYALLVADDSYGDELHKVTKKIEGPLWEMWDPPPVICDNTVHGR